MEEKIKNKNNKNLKTSLTNGSINIDTVHLSVNDKLECEDFTINSTNVKELITRWFTDLKYKTKSTQTYYYKNFQEKDSEVKKQIKEFLRKPHNLEWMINSRHFIYGRYSYPYRYLFIDNKDNYFRYLQKVLGEHIPSEHLKKFKEHWSSFSYNISLAFQYIYMEPLIKAPSKKNKNNEYKLNLSFKIDINQFKLIDYTLSEQYKADKVQGKEDSNSFPVDYDYLISAMKIFLFFELEFILHMNLEMEEFVLKKQRSIFTQKTSYEEKEHDREDKYDKKYIYKVEGSRKIPDRLTRTDLIRIACYKIDHAAVSHIKLSNILTSNDKYLYEDYFQELQQLRYKDSRLPSNSHESQFLKYKFKDVTLNGQEISRSHAKNIILLISKKNNNSINFELSIFKRENIKSKFSLPNYSITSLFSIISDGSIRRDFYKFIFNDRTYATSSKMS